jgi:hypothetical protein
MMFFRLLQASFHLLDLFRRGLGAALRLLLKSMQHVNSPGELNRVDRPISAAVFVLDYLQDAGPVEALERLRIGMLAPGLGVEQRLPDRPSDTLGNFFKSFLLDAIQKTGFGLRCSLSSSVAIHYALFSIHRHLQL